MAIITPLKKIFNWQTASEKIDSYEYKEINISSADLITPSVMFNGSRGVVLLPKLGNNQYYEWKANIEFTPGASAYTTTNTLFLYSNLAISPPLYIDNISQQIKLVWQLDSRAGFQDPTENNTIFGDSVVSNLSNTSAPYLVMAWNVGTFTGGDGTMKAKIWYKIVQFG